MYVYTYVYMYIQQLTTSSFMKDFQNWHLKFLHCNVRTELSACAACKCPYVILSYLCLFLTL